VNLDKFGKKRRFYLLSKGYTCRFKSEAFASLASIALAIIIIKYIFFIFILMMVPNSYHLIQISIVEEYRIFRTINLDKNDDFVYSTKNVYFYFDVGLFLNKKTCIIDVMAVAQWRPMTCISCQL
jgi:hypothetical protein